MINKIAKSIFTNWDQSLLALLILVYVVTFSTLSILRHNAFASNYDLANMSQTVWNTLHGRPFELSGAEGTISRFSIHADLILVLISPLYLIWERAMTLLIVQSIALGIGAIPVFLLAKKILKDKIISLALVLVYLLNPSMQWTNIYDFHGVALAIPFLLFTFYFAYIKNWKLFWVFVFLSLITKEEISLLISTIGLAIFFIFKEKAIGASTFFIGIAWFILMIFVVMPYFSPDHQTWTIKSLYTPVQQKISHSRNFYEFIDIFRGYFLSPTALDYYISMLKPFSFIPLIGFPWLMLAAPEFAVNLLSTNAQMQSLVFHYDSGITPFLIIANIFGFKYLLFLIPKSLLRYKKAVILIISVVISLVALRVNFHHSPLPTTPSCWCLSYRVTKEDIEFNEVLKKIPKNASVASSGEIRPHIARRENSFTLPGHVEDADYVAILDETRIVGDYTPKEFETTLLNDPKFLQTHELITHMGHFYLFKRKDK